MAGMGKFLIDNFKDKEIEYWMLTDNETVHYADNDLASWNIMSGIVLDYDETSCVLTMRSSQNHSLYYIHDFHIAIFWEPGVRPQDIIKSPLNDKKKNRDILGG